MLINLSDDGNYIPKYNKLNNFIKKLLYKILKDVKQKQLYHMLLLLFTINFVLSKIVFVISADFLIIRRRGTFYLKNHPKT